MATQGRPQDRRLSVADELFRHPHRFELLAAMRLLEAFYPDRQPMAEGILPSRELVAFRSRLRLDFPASEIASLVAAGGPDEPAILLANFFGMAQTDGPLPYSFTELLIDRCFRGDTAGRDFLDLFHHRLLSILYRARKKYRPTLTHLPPDRGRVGRTLSCLAGIGTRGLHERLALPDRSLLQLTGLLLGSRRSQVGLEQAITAHFGFKAEILPFRGAFRPLEADQVSHLGVQNSRLGGLGEGNPTEAAVLGKRVFLADAGFEVRLGPLDDGQLERLLPGGRIFSALEDLVHFYTDHRYSLTFRPLLAAGTPRRTRLTARAFQLGTATPAEENGRPARLGWSSWLLTRPTEKVDDQIVLRPGPKKEAWQLALRSQGSGQPIVKQPFRLDLGGALDEI